MHLDQAVCVVRRSEQDEERMRGIVIGLRALGEDAEVVAHEGMQVEQVRERLQLGGLGVADVQPEVLAAVEARLHGCEVDPSRPRSHRPARASTARAHVRAQPGRPCLLSPFGRS